MNHPTYLQHLHWMHQAIALAAAAGQAGEVPVGAIIIDAENQPIAWAENRRERDHDPTAHAEILALRQAGQRLKQWQLRHCTLYVTLEPCPMCASAIGQARLRELVYGTDDLKAGAVRTVLNLLDSAAAFHSPVVIGGIAELSCRQQLQTWFQARRFCQ